MHTAVIRTDVSRYIGIGHVMRCLAFAECLKQYNIRPIFIIRDHEESVQEMIKREGHTYISLPTRCNFDEDLSLTLKVINQYKPIFVLTDLCNINTLEDIEGYIKYLEHLKGMSNLLVTIEDIFINTKSHPADILVNMNYGAENIGYQNYHNSELLLGPTYFIFRDEFIKIASIKKIIKKEVKNILITMGGNDLLNLTFKVVKSLVGTDISNFDFKIVIGSAYSTMKKRELMSILEKSEMNYEILLSPNKMAELMLWADLAFTACGLTKYETAVLGTPNITIAQHKYEHQLMKSYDKTGCTYYLGYGKEVQKEDIIYSFNYLVSDWRKRKDMSRRGKSIANPNGKLRIINKIKEKLGGIV